MLALTKNRYWILGCCVHSVILVVLVGFGLFPQFDTIPELVEANTQSEQACFQGFCVEIPDDRSFLTRWTEYSVEYLKLASLGFLLSILAGSAAQAFFFTKNSSRVMFSNLLGIINLDGACLVVVAFIFSPVLGVGSVLLTVVISFLLGIFVPNWIKPSNLNPQISDVVDDKEQFGAAWKTILVKGVYDWVIETRKLIIRLFPTILMAVLLGWLLSEVLVVNSTLSMLTNNLYTVPAAAAFGVLLRVPTTIGIPLVVLALGMGLGIAPAATLILSGSISRLVGFRHLLNRMDFRSLLLASTFTWFIAAIGGFAVVIAVPYVSDDYGFQDSRVATGIFVDDTEKDPALINENHLEYLTGPFSFMDVTDTAGVVFHHVDPDVTLFPIGAGVVVFDFNNDGYQDIYVPQTEGPSSLFENQRDGTFLDVAVRAGVAISEQQANGGCAADYDNDGFVDMFVTTRGSSRLFSNEGDGTFVDVTDDSIPQANQFFRSTGCAWGDYNGDSNLDLVVVRHMYEQGVEILNTRDFHEAVGGMAFYRNEGDGTFSDVISLLGDVSGPKTGAVHLGNIWGAGFQPGWIDYDNDGDVDLFVVNDFGREIQPNVLWRNDGMGENGHWKFLDISKSSGVNVEMDGMGLAVGDYDLDGFLDMFVTNIGNNILFRNNGDGSTFVNTTERTGVGVGMIGRKIRIAWGTFFFDYDNDTDEDLYVVSGYLPVHQPANPRDQRNVLLRNSSDGAFVDVSAGSGADDAGIGRGGVYLDFNNDGCLDLYVVNYGQGAKLYKNTCEKVGNWLVVKLVGRESNRDGIGARLTLESGGKTQIREISGGSSSIGQNMIEAHFGLGELDVVSSLSIKWPSGITQKLTGLLANQRVVVREN